MPSPTRLAAGGGLTSVTSSLTAGLLRLWQRVDVVAAIVRREYLVRRSYRAALLMDLAFGVLNLLVYFFISRTFRGQSSVSLGHAPTYFAFAASGIVVAMVFQATTLTVARRLTEEQRSGLLEALVVEPVRPVELAIGLAGFPFLFAAARSVLYLLVARALLGLDLSNTSWAGLAAVLAASAPALMSIGIAVAAVALIVRRTEALASVTAFSLTLLGGGVFPRAVLPGPLEAFSRVVPTRFVFDGMRAALFGGGDWAHDVLVLLAFAAVALPASLWSLDKALALAIRRGTLNAG
jgi:ABC-2 type transport system permease protein